MKTTLAIALCLALLFSAVAGGLFVDVGKANFTPLPKLPPPIYIRSDGSVEPSSAGIQRVGDTYTFTSDVNNTIEVQRDNIVIDGNGFSITQTPANISGLNPPAGWYPGIRLTNRTNVTIKNVKIQDCVSGIAVESSTNITLTKNSITGIDKIAIFVARSNNLTISQNDMINSNQGILLIDSMRTDILENNITRNAIGIQLYTYTYPRKPYESATSGTAYIDIFGNYIAGNTQGIALRAFYIRIGYNTLANNNKGISFFGDSFFISIYQNNFISNSKQADIAILASGGGGTWIWDTGSEGNYWSDYLIKYPKATEKNRSGIGNTPYVIDANNKDDYPLMSEVSINPPYVILEFPSPPPSPTSSPLPATSPTPSSLNTTTPNPSASPSEQPDKTEEPQLEPFPTTLIAAVAVTSTFAVTCLVIYFKKLRRSQNQRWERRWQSNSSWH